jgi:invasion protein IalB
MLSKVQSAIGARVRSQIPRTSLKMPMKISMRIVLTASVMFLLTVVTATAADKPKSSIQSERFDDWFYRCVETSPQKGKKKGNNRCEVVQIAQTKQKEKSVNLLTVSLSEMKLGKAKKKKTVMTILTPLNVYLPAGMKLAVDKGKSVTLQYRNCNNAGCWIQHFVDAKTLRSLQSGNAGYAKLRLINGQNLKIKFSLKGLKAALTSLKSGKQPKQKS